MTTKVRIEPLTKVTSIMENVAKDGAKGYAGTKQVFTLPTNSIGAWVEILDEKEREEYAKVFSRKPEELNFFEPDPNKRHLHFWNKFTLEVSPEGLDLNMDNPIDRLKKKIAETIPQIAPSWSARYNRGEYRFVILEEDVQARENVSKVKVEQDMWKEYGKVEDVNSKLVNVLKLAGKNVSPQKINNSDYLKSEVTTFMKDSPKEFLSIVRDEDFELKVLISDAIAAKALTKGAQNKYSLPTGDTIGTYTDLMVYLKDPENAPIKLKLDAQVRNAKK